MTAKNTTARTRDFKTDLERPLNRLLETGFNFLLPADIRPSNLRGVKEYFLHSCRPDLQKCILKVYLFDVENLLRALWPTLIRFGIELTGSFYMRLRNIIQLHKPFHRLLNSKLNKFI
jgi:hypothetical protein